MAEMEISHTFVVLAVETVIMVIALAGSVWYMSKRNKEELEDLEEKVEKHVDDEGPEMRERVTALESWAKSSSANSDYPFVNGNRRR